MDTRPGAALKRGCLTLAACGYVAEHSATFLGGNFGRLFDGIRTAPLAFTATFAFYLWLVAFAAGSWWFYLGWRCLYASIDPPDKRSLLWAGGGCLVCAYSLYANWSLPVPQWGLFLSLASRAFWVALLAQNLAALGLAARAYCNAPVAPVAPNEANEAELAECRQVIAELIERDEGTSVAIADFKTILNSPDVRRLVLGNWHPDKAKTPEARLAHAEVFKIADRIFSDLAKG